MRGQKPKWCSNACRWQAEKIRLDGMLLKQCVECGTVFTPGDRRTQTCSRACTGAMVRTSRPPKPKPKPRPAVDMRSPLRKAWDDNDWDGMKEALKARSIRVDDCWEWAGQIDSKGYPGVKIGKLRIGAHRLSAMVGARRHLGSEAAHHTCANPVCVNPDHVIPASAIDNTLEMRARLGYEARIRELENALSAADPSNPALGVLPVY